MWWKNKEKTQWWWWEEECNVLEMKLVLQIQKEIDKNKDWWEHNDETLAEESVVKEKKNNEAKSCDVICLSNTAFKKASTLRTTQAKNKDQNEICKQNTTKVTHLCIQAIITMLMDQHSGKKIIVKENHNAQS